MSLNLPVEFQTWDTIQCAEYFGNQPEHFRRVTRYKEGFPQPLASSNAKRPRWSAKAVIEWALK